MSDNGLSSNGWANTLNNQRLLDPSGQLNHLNNMSNDLVASNLNQLAGLNQLNNASLFSSAADSNDSNDEDSRDSLRGSNSEINLNGDGKPRFKLHFACLGEWCTGYPGCSVFISCFR